MKTRKVVEGWALNIVGHGYLPDASVQDPMPKFFESQKAAEEWWPYGNVSFLQPVRVRVSVEVEEI